MKTNKDIKLTGQRYGGLTVPAGTRVVPMSPYPTQTKPQYWVDEFQWIEQQTGFKDSLYKHDAIHYGIVIDWEDVTASLGKATQDILKTTS